jgi:hypothetical protein
MGFPESLLRLAIVVALLVWLPGWLAARRALLPIRVLHPSLVGLGLFVALLAGAASFTQQVDAVAGGVLGGTLALLVLFGLARWTWPVPPAAPDEPRVGVLLGAVAFVCVGGAALLRVFHNYHFDDFQHLVYLTTIRQEGQLFPGALMLDVPWAATGGQAVYVTRYPFWGAAHVVLAVLAGVPIGDAYFLLGLGTLALVLGLLALMLRDLLGSAAAALVALAVLFAGGHFLSSDEILNYGGYPFQAGKLFVFVAAIACVAYWKRGRRQDLVTCGVALALAPLIHTNNSIGVVLVVGGALSLAAASRSRPLATAAAIPAVVVVAVTVLGLLTDGFVRVVVPSERPEPLYRAGVASDVLQLPENAAARHPQRGAPPALAAARVRPVGMLDGWQVVEHEGWYFAVPPAIDVRRLDAGTLRSLDGVHPAPSLADLRRELRRRSVTPAPSMQTDDAGNVGGRQALFLRRALPTELLPALLVVAVCLTVPRGHALKRLAGVLVLTGCTVAALTQYASALSRQVATTAFKPGYLSMRSSLVEVAGVVSNSDVLTDPITHVYGSAAGWTLPNAPPFSLEAQFRLLALFHPDIRGAALEYIWAAGSEPMLVVNEAVLGPAAAAKFDELEGPRRLLATDQPVPGEDAMARRAEAVVEQLYALDYASLREDLGSHARSAWRAVFRRPLYVFAPPERWRPLALDAVPAALDASPVGTAGAGADERIDQRPFLNTVMVRAAVPVGCFDQSILALEGTGSFESQVMVHVLPASSAGRHTFVTSEVFPGRLAEAAIRFREPVCGPGDLAFFIHGNRLYDFRFAVRSIDWRRTRDDASVLTSSRTRD